MAQIWFYIRFQIEEKRFQQYIEIPEGLVMAPEFSEAFREFSCAISETNIKLINEAGLVGGAKINIPDEKVFEIAEDLEAAFEKFAGIAEKHGYGKRCTPKCRVGIWFRGSNKVRGFCFHGGNILAPDGYEFDSEKAA